ncbi:MAG: response regulator transcription factor [Alistipes sp.]|nr:response regulator transcription factor [Alistipes sp.]
MKALIIEDEVLSRNNLVNAIERMFDDIEIAGSQESVKGSVEFLKRCGSDIDVIFMDVELSDGMCFDIFDQTEITAKVIITTAYDNYAIKAFEINSIDYILKPIDPEALRRAVERCRRALRENRPHTGFDAESLREALSAGRSRKHRFVIHIGDRITIVNTSDIACIYAEDKCTYILTAAGKRYIIDQTLNGLQDDLDPSRFFRISRSCIVAVDSIVSISRTSSGKMLLTLQPKPDFEVAVSRFRTGEFLDWLEGK